MCKETWDGVFFFLSITFSHSTWKCRPFKGAALFKHSLPPSLQRFWAERQCALHLIVACAGLRYQAKPTPCSEEFKGCKFHTNDEENFNQWDAPVICFVNDKSSLFLILYIYIWTPACFPQTLNFPWRHEYEINVCMILQMSPSET